MDRLALLLGFLVGLAYGRFLDPQWRRDLRWKLSKWITPDEPAAQLEARKRRAREAANAG